METCLGEVIDSIVAVVYVFVYSVVKCVRGTADNMLLYFYARVALKILFLNEPPGELRNRIFNATSA